MYEGVVLSGISGRWLTSNCHGNRWDLNTIEKFLPRIYLHLQWAQCFLKLSPSPLRSAVVFFHKGTAVCGSSAEPCSKRETFLEAALYHPPCTYFRASSAGTPVGWKALKPLPGAYSLIVMIRFQKVSDCEGSGTVSRGKITAFKMPPTPLLSASLGLPTTGRGWSHSLQDKPSRWAARRSGRCSLGWCPLASPSRRPPTAAGNIWKQPISPLLVFPLLLECKFLLPSPRINTPAFFLALAFYFAPVNNSKTEERALWFRKPAVIKSKFYKKARWRKGNSDKSLICMECFFILE